MTRYFMRGWLVAALIWLSVSSMVKASSFGFGRGVPMTDGLAAVNFNFDKGFRYQIAGDGIGLVEVRLTFTNGITKRTSLLYAGPIAFRTPLPVEVVELSGGLLLVLVFFTIVLLWHSSGTRHGESPDSPNVGPPAPSGSSGATGG